MKSNCYIIFLLFLILTQFISGDSKNLDKYKLIFDGAKSIQTRKYAKIPNYKGKAAGIVGITSFGPHLFVCTSVSGGHIYKISPSPSGPRVSLWLNVAKALSSKGRELDFSNRIEGGVRSIAFHPNFAKNRRFYVSLMEKATKPPATYRFLSRPPIRSLVSVHSVVVEFRAARNSLTPLPSTIRDVLRIGFKHYFHTIKQIIFQGRFLIIGHGDGAPDKEAVKGGQWLTDGLGKILRIDPLPAPGNKPYRIPANNPFRNQGGAKPEIYALGFHNPHNLCLARNGNLFIADTGRDNVEEINLIRGPGGPRNYGWSRREGHFKHLLKGGVDVGIAPLPKSGDRFVYPSAVLPHFAPKGRVFVGQSIAMSCPIENGSPLSGLLLYANFPTDGQVYYSTLKDLRAARTTGIPSKLTWARTYKAKVLFDHDSKPGTPPLKLENLRDVIRKEPGLAQQKRVDMRFGAGQKGEIYWSSKKSGWIYVITNSFS